MNLLEVKIRFNTNYPSKSDKKWRLLFLGTEKLVDDIKIECSSFTTIDEVKGDDGQMVTKYHISTICSQVKYEEEQNGKIIKAIIK